MLKFYVKYHKVSHKSCITEFWKKLAAHRENCQKKKTSGSAGNTSKKVPESPNKREKIF